MSADWPSPSTSTPPPPSALDHLAAGILKTHELSIGLRTLCTKASILSSSSLKSNLAALLPLAASILAEQQAAEHACHALMNKLGLLRLRVKAISRQVTVSKFLISRPAPGPASTLPLAPAVPSASGLVAAAESSSAGLLKRKANPSLTVAARARPGPSKKLKILNDSAISSSHPSSTTAAAAAHSTATNFPGLRRPHDLPQRFLSQASYTRYRYMHGRLAVDSLTSTVLAHSLSPAGDLAQATARDYLKLLSSTFSATGLMYSVLAALVNAGPTRSLSARDIETQVDMTMRQSYQVYSYAMRWTLRPMVVACDLHVAGSGLRHEWDALVAQLTPVERRWVENGSANMVRLIGIELDGYEEGLFEDSVYPSSDVARFRLRERIALVVEERSVTDGSSSESGEEVGFVGKVYCESSTSNEEDVDSLAERSADSMTRMSRPISQPTPSTFDPLLTLPVLPATATYTYPLTLPPALLESLRKSKSNCMIRFSNGQLQVQHCARQVIAHTLLLPRALDPATRQAYLTHLNIIPKFKIASPVIVRALLALGFGARMSHAAIADAVRQTSSEPEYNIERAVEYAFNRPVFIVSKTADRRIRPDLWATMLSLAHEQELPKGAELALLLGVDCVGLQEPRGDERMREARERTYVLSERLAVIVPTPAKGAAAVGGQRGRTRVTEESESDPESGFDSESDEG